MPVSKDIGDRLNELRAIWVEDKECKDYLNYDIGVKMVIAAGIVELVKIGRENQEITNILESIESHLHEIEENTRPT
jgi:hypothetical protein